MYLYINKYINIYLSERVQIVAATSTQTFHINIPYTSDVSRKVSAAVCSIPNFIHFPL